MRFEPIFHEIIRCSSRNKVKYPLSLVMFFLCSIPVTACTERNIPWRLDASYSEFLTISASNYKAMTGNDIGGSADAMRIYKTSGTGRKMFSLSHLLNEDPIYESNDKQFIEEFISSAQETIMHAPNCFEHRERDSFHILVFDNTFMRAGYFLVIKCTADNETLGIISPYRRRVEEVSITAGRLLLFWRNSTF